MIIKLARSSSKPGKLRLLRDNLGGAYRRYFPLIVVLWILSVLYPNPLMLIISIQRVLSFNIDPEAVQFMLDDLPSDPQAIEKVVLTLITYRYDWEVYKVPWYFPTVKEALKRGEGDCKARALVLASVFEAKDIPYRINLSPIHIWVDYEGKQENPIENAQVRFFQRDAETGERSFQIPRIRISEVMNSFWEGFWKPMPKERKFLLFSGLSALIIIRTTWLRNEATRRGKAISF